MLHLKKKHPTIWKNTLSEAFFDLSNIGVIITLRVLFLCGLHTTKYYNTKVNDTDHNHVCVCRGIIIVTISKENTYYKSLLKL